MHAIDMHNHLIAPEVADFLKREGEKYATRLIEQDGQRFFIIQESSRRPYNDKISRPEARLPDMDSEGIGIQAVSCVPFLMYPEVAADLGLAIAQVNNEALAAIGQRLSDRFMPLASVPLQDPPAAARELERVAKLGLRGVEIPPRIHDQGLDEPQFAVFWETAEALQMVVCIHPFEAAPRGMLARYGLGVLAGNLFDTGLAAAVLIYGGVLERHPKLRVVLYHAGGALPSMLGRLDMGFERIPDCRSAIPRPPSSYVNQFCFDTIAFNPAMLHYLANTYGAESLVIGTDYPLPAGIMHPVAEVKALGLPAETESAILSGNARRLLRLP
ncbi:MAG: amidohydrolase family protein [Deltaproteobacteria bacterium]|nr:amidohydrolase family protein [Deltaproteobacteria bacterium]